MITRPPITDIVCPKCASGEIAYANDRDAALNKADAMRARPSGWFCYECRYNFKSPTRVPYDPLKARHEERVTEQRKRRPHRGSPRQNERVKSNVVVKPLS